MDYTEWQIRRKKTFPFFLQNYKSPVGLVAAFFNSSLRIFTRIWWVGKYFLHRWIHHVHLLIYFDSAPW